MTCIIVDDEPLAREAIKLLIAKAPGLSLLAEFKSAAAAALFFEASQTDIIFLDIQMPGMTGLAFAQAVPEKTMVVFTTAYSQYALDSYEVDALDYLVKPIKEDRFLQAVNKAAAYQQLLQKENTVAYSGAGEEDFAFIRADSKVFKVYFKDVLFIEGLKDYVVIQTPGQKIITAMNIKTIYGKLPSALFFRTSKSYIINTQKIDSFDNNTVRIGNHEIPIGNAYRTSFFDEVVSKKLLSR